VCARKIPTPSNSKTAMAASIMKLTPDAGCCEHKMQLRRGDGYVVPERRFQCWTKEIAPVTFLPHGEGLRSPRSLRCYRPDVRPPEPADFSFGFAGCRRQLLRFKFLRFGRGRADESGGPPLFESSFKMEGDTGHVTSASRSGVG